MSYLNHQTNKRGLINAILVSSIVALGLNFWQFALAAGNGRATFVLPATSPSASPKPATAAQQVSSALPADTTTNATPATPQPASPNPNVANRLSQAGLKPDFADLYVAASAKTGTPWQLLAAVHLVETGQSSSTNRASYAGAKGPMQFMPATFRAWGIDGNADGIIDITNIDDAMFSAGRYLTAGGADKGKYTTALYHYNHSNAYVSKVMGIARRLGL